MIKPYILPAWLVCCLSFLLSLPGHAQVTGKTGIAFKPGLPQKLPRLQSIDAGQHNFYFIQFNQLPTSAERKRLSLRGIELLDYIPANTYLARVHGKWMSPALSALGVTGLLPLDSSFKRNNLLEPATTSAGKYKIIQFTGQGTSIVEKQLTAAEAARLQSDKEVLYLVPSSEMKVLNMESTEVLQADRVRNGWNGQPGLDGSGVVVGVGDNGQVYHLDLHYNETGISNSGEHHATHVAGAIAGGGYINPYYRGFAPGASIIAESFDYILLRTPEYYRNKGMVITNNSYGAGSTCIPVSGQYSIYCAEVDRLALDYPEVLHLFALGNSGSLTCTPFPTGYKSMDNAYQAAKNVLTVGGSTVLAQATGLSKGPAMDGRLKPEISAVGRSVMSTVPVDSYGLNSGTSMATPEVSGCVALLYQKYRQMNEDKNPGADLIKAVVCNTATDIGRKGIDFEYGFGWVNPADAVDLLQNRWYFSGTAEQGSEQTFTVNVPKASSNLRFLLYWADQPSSLYSKLNLVNDLDISVTYPDGSVHYPMVLDTSATGITLLPKEGEDHLNNIEQVQTDQAVAGTYTIKVRGSAVAFGPQSFRVVYYYKDPALALLQPVGGEAWKGGELRRILWQYPSTPDALLEMALSIDDGQTWTALGTTRNELGMQQINIPQVSTTTARVRLREPATGETRVSGAFTILPELPFQLSSPCRETLELRWSKSSGIDSVQLYQYDTGYLVPKGLYGDTVITISGVRAGMTQWVSLAPVKNGKEGERAVAQAVLPSAATCTGGTANDLSLAAILLPGGARQYTTGAPGTPIQVRYIVENKGSTTFSDSLIVETMVDGAMPVLQRLVRNIPGNRRDTLTAPVGIPAVASGDHTVQIRIMGRGDDRPENDSAAATWTFAPNPLLELPLSENFAAVPEKLFGNPGRFGLPGAYAFDFSTSSTALKLVTRPGDSAGLYSNSRIRFQTYLVTATYNLSAYRLIDNVYLDIDLPSIDYSQLVFQLRGSDTRPWITMPQSYFRRFNGKHLNIGFFFALYGQQFSTSTQFRIRFTDQTYRESLHILRGIRWYTVPHDVSVDALLSGTQYLVEGDSLPVRAIIQNQSLTTQYQIPVSFQADGRELASVTIDSLPALYYADTSLLLSTAGFNTGITAVRAIAQMANDDLRINDTGTVSLLAYRRVSRFPYFESFDSGRADWYNTAFYQLSDSVASTLPPFAAANGKQYWRPQPVFRGANGYDAVFTGYLYSPAYQIQNLQQPMLSMSVNKQLCDGKDSVIVQASPDNGTTWVRVDASQNAYHYYDSASHGAFRRVCDTADWQVVTVPLPKWKAPIILRFSAAPRDNTYATVMPKVSAGLLIDDIHVYDGAAMPVSTPVPGFARNTYNGHVVLPKLWTLPATDTARLFFTHEEWASWTGRRLCDTCSLQGNPYRLSVFRYTGAAATIDSTDANNAPDGEVEITADSFYLVPFANGYFASLHQVPAGEYYIGRPGKTSLVLHAEKQEGADAVILNWTTNQQEGVRGFAIERAERIAETDGTWTEIAYQPAATHLAYRYRDAQIRILAGYHYRIRLDYGNSLRLYSAVETVSFEGRIRATLYPNPWQSGDLQLYLQNLEGRSLELQLFDLQGKKLWGKSVPALSRQQVLHIEEAVRGRPAGVYFLKMDAMGQKRTFRLVISGK